MPYQHCASSSWAKFSSREIWKHNRPHHGKLEPHLYTELSSARILNDAWFQWSHFCQMKFNFHSRHRPDFLASNCTQFVRLYVSLFHVLATILLVKIALLLGISSAISIMPLTLPGQRLIKNHLWKISTRQIHTMVLPHCSIVHWYLTETREASYKESIILWCIQPWLRHVCVYFPILITIFNQIILIYFAALAQSGQ